MNDTDIWLASLIIVVCAILAFIPLDKSRTRARWAKTLFLCVAAVGIFMGICEILIHTHVIRSEPLHRSMHSLRGFCIGLLVALVVSGQLKGSKKTSGQPEARP